MTPNDFLSIREVAEQTGLSVAALRSYRQRNGGPVSYRVAGRVVYGRDAVRDWIAAQMAESVRGGR